MTERDPNNARQHELLDGMGIPENERKEGKYGVYAQGINYFNNVPVDGGTDNSADTIDLGEGGRVSRKEWREFEKNETDAQRRAEDLSRQYPE